MGNKYTLQDHQQIASKKINEQNHQLLYHGLGSGKTLTALVNRRGKTDMIVPASLRSNVHDTVRKFGLDSKKLNVVSYEKASKGGLSGDTLILDEAHRIGDFSSARSKEVRKIAKEYERVILLSGSPIKNKPHEIAPLAHAININESDVPLTEKAFNEKYIAKINDKLGLWDRLSGRKAGFTQKIKNKAMLKKIFKGKVDYFQPGKDEYPSVLHKTNKVEMSPKQHSVYRSLVNKADSDVVYKIDSGRPMTSAEKQKANSFLTAARILSNTTAPYGHNELAPKIKMVTNNIANSLGKSVVYSSFLDGGIHEVSKSLKKKKIKHAIFSGKMNDKEKRKVIQDYNMGANNVLLISGAGAEGLDLKETRNMHILEPHWNEARINQVIGRGSRYKSHSALPKKDQNMTVQRYTSIFPKEKKGVFDFLTQKKKKVAADEYMLDLAKKKEELNQDFLKAIR